MIIGHVKNIDIVALFRFLDKIKGIKLSWDKPITPVFAKSEGFLAL